MRDFAGDESGSSDSLLGIAEAVAETLRDHYAEVTEAIAVQYAQQGEVDRATEIADKIPDPYLKDQAVGLIAAFSVDADSPDFTSDLLNSIEDPIMFEMAVERVATRYAQLGQIEEAISTASQLAVNDTVQGNLALIAANRGQLAEARDLATSIESPAVRASTLALVAFSLGGTSQNESATQLIADIQNAIEELEANEERAEALVSIGSIYLSLGEDELAISSFEEAHDLVMQLEGEPQETTSSFVKDVALGQMVTGFAQLKKFDRADEILGEIEDPFQFAHTAIALALLSRDQGQDSQIDELLSQAREIWDEEGQYGQNSAKQRDSLFAELAQAMASLGRFDQALTTASSIGSAEDRLRAAKMIGELAARAGLDDIWSRAVKIIETSSGKVSYWLLLSDVFAQLEQTAGSQEAISRALNNAKSIENPYDRCIALADTALRLFSLGRDEEGSATFIESISIVPSIDGGYLKVHALLNLAQKCQTVNRDLSEEELQTLKTMLVQLE